MKKYNYTEMSEFLVKAIDIAILAFREHPPKIFDEHSYKLMLDYYCSAKEDVLIREKKFRNLTSLKYDIADVFTYFQESSGETVNFFWDNIKKENLPFKRENKMKKILKRRRINNNQEYDFVIDVMIPYLQEGLINDNDIIVLNKLISEFENKHK